MSAFREMSRCHRLLQRFRLFQPFRLPVRTLLRGHNPAMSEHAGRFIERHSGQSGSLRASGSDGL
jgi:hypothetical protein